MNISISANNIILPTLFSSTPIIQLELWSFPKTRLVDAVKRRLLPLWTIGETDVYHGEYDIDTRQTAGGNPETADDGPFCGHHTSAGNYHGAGSTDPGIEIVPKEENGGKRGKRKR